MRCALALTALLLAACADTVVLGTECLTASACEQLKPGPGNDGADTGSSPSELIDGGESSLDGGSNEQPPVEPPRDSGPRPTRDTGVVPVRDAARPPPVPADAGPATYLEFVNPSFELVDGASEGPVGEFGQNAPAQAQSPIAPWSNDCRSGASVVSSATYGLPPRQITPREGATFVTDTIPIVVFNTNGIKQELAEPLVPGRRYAFAIDVFAQLDLVMLRELVLDVMYPDEFVECLGRPLAVTLPIPPGSWQTRCIDFIAPELGPLSRPIRSLMLMPNVPGDLLNFTAVLHFDNIRPATPALCNPDAGAP